MSDFVSLTADLDGTGSVLEKAYMELSEKTGLGVATLHDAALEAAGLTGNSTFNTVADEASAVQSGNRRGTRPSKSSFGQRERMLAR